MKYLLAILFIGCSSTSRTKYVNFEPDSGASDTGASDALESGNDSGINDSTNESDILYPNCIRYGLDDVCINNNYPPYSYVCALSSSDPECKWIGWEGDNKEIVCCFKE